MPSVQSSTCEFRVSGTHHRRCLCLALGGEIHFVSAGGLFGTWLCAPQGASASCRLTTPDMNSFFPVLWSPPTRRKGLHIPYQFTALWVFDSIDVLEVFLNPSFGVDELREHAKSRSHTWTRVHHTVGTKQPITTLEEQLALFSPWTRCLDVLMDL